ncbi:hypothetical protein LJR066_004079 [Acidovorax sp. LjRoot66]|uniref:hypothetical protein n=1 Tax=unclassified Acidovorax TaxID=2684926 RepID=UPI0007090832|nr:hypothetical protein [Acidovorax sp. Root219]KRC26649.1 hypothetical protein ASE28_23655 [Acidovorax sp. Root219]
MKSGSFILPALAAMLALASLPAQAIGRLADITIVDRETGATLPVHYAKGEYWVAGRPGARYAVTVHNRLGERVLAVPSVDGVNVLSGETAAWDQRGYVFSPYERYQITGWRKSSSEIAAFEFSSAGNSYAGRTGRPANVGVIGVALFREQPPLPAPPVVQEPLGQRRDSSSDNRLGRLREEPASPAAAAPTPASEAESSARSQSAGSLAKAAPAPSPKLGTAHGQRETSVVTQTTFTRLQEQPNEVISIRYDSRENLVASGVIREQPVRPPVPRAFPQSDNVSYVPDPK